MHERGSGRLINQRTSTHGSKTSWAPLAGARVEPRDPREAGRSSFLVSPGDVQIFLVLLVRGLAADSVRKAAVFQIHSI